MINKIEMVRDAKLVLLGDSGVGKSSLIYRFLYDDFRPFSESTIGASFMSKVVGDIHFKVWDTAGQEKYRSLGSMYFRGAKCAILVFDVTNSKSFQGLQTWYEDLVKNRNEDEDGPLITICGNKVDLEQAREVEEENAARYAKDIGASYFETSAKVGTNIGKVFMDIASRLPEEDENLAVDNVGSSMAGQPFRIDFMNGGFAEQNSRLANCC